MFAAASVATIHCIMLTAGAEQGVGLELVYATHCTRCTQDLPFATTDVVLGLGHVDEVKALRCTRRGDGA